MLLRGPSADSNPASLGFERHSDGPGLMVDFGLKGGDRLSIPYCYISAIRLDPSNAITLELADRSIVIKGRNLLPLYNNLVLHAAFRVNVTDTGFDDGSASTWIESIEIVPCGGDAEIV